MRGKRLLIVVVAAMAAACTSGPDVSHYTAVLDKLSLPAGWELVHTTVREPGGGDKEVDPGRSTDTIGCSGLFGQCPSIARYFQVDADAAIDVYKEAKRILIASGFAITHEFLPTCDAITSAAECTVVAAKGADAIVIGVYRPGGSTGDGLETAPPGRSFVRVIAHAK
jgi:nucleotide-binding universal stress UspA family protein